MSSLTTKTAIFLLLALVAIGSFFAGMYWRKETLGGLQKWKLTEPIELQESPNQRGALPAGAILYEYELQPEVGTYIVFIKTLRRDVLEEYKSSDDRDDVIIPLSGFLSRTHKEQ